MLGDLYPWSLGNLHQGCGYILRVGGIPTLGVSSIFILELWGISILGFRGEFHPCGWRRRLSPWKVSILTLGDLHPWSLGNLHPQGCGFW